MLPSVLSVVACISCIASGRKIRLAVNVLNGLIDHADNESRNLTLNAKHVLGTLAQGREDTSGEPPAATHDESNEWRVGGKYEKGRCCKKKRKGEKVYRWFYWEEDGIVKPNNGLLAYCPSTWNHADDYDCSQNGAEVWNQYDYVDNTDWVLCCSKRGDKVEYTYFDGGECESNTAWFNCQSYHCTSQLNVNAADVTCVFGYDKIVNEDAPYCKQSNKGMTSEDCAGYPSDCEKAYCYYNSYSVSDDCRDKCAGFESASKANPESRANANAESRSTEDRKQGGNYQRSEGFPLIGWIGIGVFVLVAVGMVACMCTKKGKGSSSGNTKGNIPQDDAIGYMPPNCKGEGKGYNHPRGAPQYLQPSVPLGAAGGQLGYGGQPQTSGPFTSMPPPPPTWGVFFAPQQY